ncbi:PP-loop family protein [Aspergillus steynii IBT 23096]|uniref:tRNA(Ile)-lysidine synthetase n=1 Tax=Aspergillus steynii IBT 23096 TaxID=1392250 RepID=A0A2I2G327_9EURO|nr:PP-loop family protein [Aspergillus steynii IBT 23096]PLB47283.1 PP-loop family protein [Aspergillus steynii IBT 23096]
MAGSCLLRSSNSGAISTPKFLENFKRVWLESRAPRAERRRETRLPRRIGLAVSGGADSMALAYLCRQWEKTHSRDDVAVTAFVVDHKARAESTREAATVTRWLTDLGIHTQILELSWSQSTQSQTPSQVSAFETHARRLRFQALGTACRDHRIQALLMGHHQDDNVETTLWRLCSGARGAGLAGIPEVNPIPECHGLFGVAESGSSVILQGVSSASRRIPMSTGGIFICRPLLSFPKARLLATCHDNHVPYVSDPTNFDPTLTPRNAIRSLLSSDRLPRALQTPSVLSLVEKSQDLVRDTTDLSNELLQKCKILDLNLATGTMTVQFPSSSAAAIPNLAPSITHQIQTTTLRRITDLIAPFPDNHFPLRSFEDFTSRVFQDSGATKIQAFTLGGVMFQPHPKPLDTSPSSTNNNHPHTPPLNPSPNTTNSTWFLSRQPFRKNCLPTLNLSIPIPTQTHPEKNTSTTEPQDNHLKLKQTTPWTLWDDRYWLRFSILQPGATHQNAHQNNNKNENENGNEKAALPLVLRPLLKSDIQLIRRNKNKPLDQFLKRLAKEAPGLSRFTLPVVVIPKGESGLEEDLPVGLPTMEQWVPGAQEVMRSRSIAGGCSVEWEWMYKMVDTEPLRLMGGLERDP